MRDAAAEFDDLQPSLDVALGVGDHLAVFGAEQVGERVHVRLDQFLEAEHDAGAALRVGRRPAGLRLLRGGDGAIEVGLFAERDAGLHATAIGVEHVAMARGSAAGMADDEMVDVAHDASPFAHRIGLRRIAGKGVKCDP